MRRTLFFTAEEQEKLSVPEVYAAFAENRCLSYSVVWKKDNFVIFSLL